MTSRISPSRYGPAFWLVVALTGLAAALRITDLDVRSLWLDEGFTLLRMLDTWQRLLNNEVYLQGIRTIDPHPAFYFALLKVWGGLFGNHVFAMRLFSPACAVLLVPLTYVVARRFASARASVLAAAWAALSPAYQWYGWELRMYTLVPLMAALMMYALLRANMARPRAGRWWAAWLLATVVACLSHYTLLCVALVHGVLVVASLAQYRWRSGWRAMLVGGAVAAVVGIALVLSSGLSGLLNLIQINVPRMQARYAGVELGPYLTEMFGGALFGLNAADPSGGWVLLLVGVCCVISTAQLLAVRTGPRNGRMSLLPALTMLVPLLCWAAMSYLIENRPSFRYLIVIVLPMQVLLARFVDEAVAALSAKPWLKRAAGVLMSGVLSIATVAQAFGLGYTFMRVPGWQDDWRTLAKVIRENWQPGDVVLLNLYAPEIPIKLYLRSLPVEVLPDYRHKMSELLTSDRAKRWITQSYRRLWYANAGARPIGQGNSADGILAGLHQRDHYVFDGRSNIVELRLYDMDAPMLANVPADAVAVDGDGAVAGYAIQPGSPYHDLPNLRLSVYWRTGQANHKLAVRLLHQNQVWLDWLLPAQLQFAPQLWPAGELYRVDYAVPVPLGLPALPYDLQLHVLAGQKGEVVQSLTQPLSPALLACCVRIVGWGTPQPSQAMVSPLASPLPSFGLLNPPASSFIQASPHQDLWRGSDVSLVQAEFAAERQPGDPLPIVLTWRAQQANLNNWETELRLETWWGGEVTVAKRTAGVTGFPASAWPQGQPMRDMYALQVPFTVSPGWYRLSLARWRDGAKMDSVWLGWLQVLAPSPSPVPTSIAHPINNPGHTRIGEATLLGYGIDQAVARGATLDLHTYWRFGAQPMRDGVLSVRAFLPDGTPGPQDDNPPEGGLRSTRNYRAGDGLDQVHRIVIPQDAPEGEYKLYALIYDKPEQGAQRWPAQQDGQPAKDDMVYLGSFNLPKLPEFGFKTYLPVVQRS